MNDKQAKTDAYIFLQCGDDACRFRFPAPAAEVAGVHCPRCRGAVSHGDDTWLATLPAGDGPTHWSNGAPPLAALLDNIRSVHNV